MAVPRNRVSNARKNSRRAHHAKKPKQLGTCGNCSAIKVSHVICPSCGFYAGRQVLAPKS
jgi:large subunit ribosomal protein L32